MTPPTRYALVPVEATEEMIEQTFVGNSLEWRRVLDASPNGGCVTAEMLLEASIVFQKAHKRGAPIYDAMRAALTALGLTVADVPAGEEK